MSERENRVLVIILLVHKEDCLPFHIGMSNHVDTWFVCLVLSSVISSSLLAVIVVSIHC